MPTCSHRLFFRNPAPSVLRTVNAQPITRPDSSFSPLLSACSAACPGLDPGCSSSCICAKILALRCCGQMIAEVLMGRRRRRCSKRFNPWNQAYRNRPAPPCRSTSTQRNDFAFLSSPEGGARDTLPPCRPPVAASPRLQTARRSAFFNQGAVLRHSNKGCPYHATRRSNQ
jgi:hypothetical protein